MNHFLEFFTFENTLFLAGMIGFFSVLISWHRNQNNTIDLKTILIKDGELSLSKLGQLIALLVSTWIIVYQTRHELLNEWLFTSYLFTWTGANVMSKYLGPRPPAPRQDNENDPAEPTDTADFRDFRSSQVQKRNP